VLWREIGHKHIVSRCSLLSAKIMWHSLNKLSNFSNGMQPNIIR